MTKEELYKEFPVISLTRVDLGNAGFDVTNVTDSTMIELVQLLEEEYKSTYFEDSLKAFASYLKIPKIKDYD